MKHTTDVNNDYSHTVPADGSQVLPQISKAFYVSVRLLQSATELPTLSGEITLLYGTAKDTLFQA